jgi:uncharacterized Zn-binding protein involved in type VI secretion
MSSQPAARLTDPIVTGTPANHGCNLTSTILGGNIIPIPTVFINGLPAAVLGDIIAPHTIGPGGAPCVPHTAFVTTGSAFVYISGVPAARVGDVADLGTIGPTGSLTVFMG